MQMMSNELHKIYERIFIYVHSKNVPSVQPHMKLCKTMARNSDKPLLVNKMKNVIDMNK